MLVLSLRSPARSEPVEKAFEVDAPAKLNFYLHVLGRRSTGYHDLSSLVGFVDVGDTVRVEPSSEFQFFVDGPMADPELGTRDNLCVRAAHALANALGRSANFSLTLTKRLPVASGIGGGSADAAATLRLLMHMWQADISRADMDALALSLGADVPVCLAGVAAEMYGIGEVLHPVEPLPPVSVVLVNPGVCVSTAEIFRGWNGPGPEVPSWTHAETSTMLAASLMKRRNDLTEVAKAQAPVIGEVLSVLTARPECLLARMSGSGATCFGLFHDFSVADAAADVLQVTHPHWWVRAARTLDVPPPIREVAIPSKSPVI